MDSLLFGLQQIQCVRKGGIIIQAIGFAGMAFFIASYQMRSNRMLFLFQLIGCLIFIAQFTVMGAYTGALGLAVNVLRNLLLLKIGKWKWVESKITLAAILILLAGVTAYTWGGAANEAIALLSIIVSIFRFGWSNLAESPADFSKKEAARAEVSASVQEKKAA